LLPTADSLRERLTQCFHHRQPGDARESDCTVHQRIFGVLAIGNVDRRCNNTGGWDSAPDIVTPSYEPKSARRLCAGIV
jgi:hypothetical protein